MWDNKPASYSDINSLIVSLKSKNVDIKHYIGNFGFDWSGRYAYYLTPKRKLMRVKTTWESATNGGGLLMMKIHWSETDEV